MVFDKLDEVQCPQEIDFHRIPPLLDIVVSNHFETRRYVGSQYHSKDVVLTFSVNRQRHTRIRHNNVDPPKLVDRVLNNLRSGFRILDIHSKSQHLGA